MEHNQSAFLRSVLEILVAAVEKLTQDIRYAAEYAALARERTPEDDEFAQGALRTAAHLWRESE